MGRSPTRQSRSFTVAGEPYCRFQIAKGPSPLPHWSIFTLKSSCLCASSTQLELSARSLDASPHMQFSKMGIGFHRALGIGHWVSYWRVTQRPAVTELWRGQKVGGSACGTTHGATVLSPHIHSPPHSIPFRYSHQTLIHSVRRDCGVFFPFSILSISKGWKWINRNGFQWSECLVRA